MRMSNKIQKNYPISCWVEYFFIFMIVYLGYIRDIFPIYEVGLLLDLWDRYLVVDISPLLLYWYIWIHRIWIYLYHPMTITRSSYRSDTSGHGVLPSVSRHAHSSQRRMRVSPPGGHHIQKPHIYRVHLTCYKNPYQWHHCENESTHVRLLMADHAQRSSHKRVSRVLRSV